MTLRETGFSRFFKSTVTAASVLFVMSAGNARADESHAKELLKAMSDYMAAQNSFSFAYDTTLEVVTSDGQKLALASSGAAEVNRPDKMRATRTGGFADVEMLFDGKTLTLFGKNLNVYSQAELPGSLDNLTTVLREKFQRPLPAADLLMSNPYEALMADVKDVKDLGSGVIRGQECDHLAFRAADIDWQIWIAQGEAPYPCRFVVTSSAIAQAPQYSIDVRDWKASTEAGTADFTFRPPADAKMVKPEELKDFDELPSHLAPQQ